MDDKVSVSKKNAYIILFVFFVLLIIVLSQLALQSNQANNSKASETKNEALLIPTAGAPTLDQQQNMSHRYSASRDVTGNIELIGTPPQIEKDGEIYSIYMSKGGTLTHIDTFKATKITVNEKFTTFWKPKNTVSNDDVQNNIFFLFKVN